MKIKTIGDLTTLTETLSGEEEAVLYTKNTTYKLKLSELDHSILKNIGTNSHSAIDAFIASKGQPGGLAVLDLNGEVGANADLLDGFHASKNAQGSEIPVLTDNQSLLIGLTDDTVNSLQLKGSAKIQSGNISLLIGANSEANTITNLTNKTSRIATPHYNTTEEPVIPIAITSNSTDNNFYLGGGSSLGNSSSGIYFFTAENNNTLTGTERMRINSSGNVLIGTTNDNSYKLSVVNATTDTQALGLTTKITSTMNTSATQYHIGASIQTADVITAAGITNSGYSAGIISNTYISSSDNHGTLSRQYSLWGRTGINTAGTGTVITDSYAIYADVLNKSSNGTITNAYGVYINNSDTTGTITNRWGLYQEGSTARNYLQGRTLIGSNVDDGVNALQVTGSALFTDSIKTNKLLRSEGSFTNTSYPNGLYIRGTNTITSTGTYYLRCVDVAPQFVISSGVTNNGGVAGIYSDVLRNIGSSNDNGTLAAILAGTFSYGHWNSFAATPITTDAYGIKIAPYIKSGTITNMYDIFLSADSTGGTVTNRWGIYQANTAPNVLLGDLLLGTANLSNAKVRIATDSTSGSLNPGIEIGAGSGLSQGGAIGSRTITSNARQGLYISAVGTLSLNATSYNIDFNTGGITPADDTNLRMRISSSGNVLIGTATDDTINKLQINGSTRINSGSLGLVIGADNDATTVTNNTYKSCRILGAPYANSSIPSSMLTMFTYAATTELFVGGGTASANASTLISFWTAANTTTTTGTERMRITSTGNILIGTTVDDGVNKLQTSGNAKISGNLEVTGLITANGSSGIGAVGGGTDSVFYENDQSVTTNYTITSGKNAMSAGPITINTGVTVTVPEGSTWSII